ncbi:hypothetical protein M0R45_006635 [Rubus argutus]|uniref:Uncharacterized protein n=1 Tax=Rubus argutus TaxID=59490 RepID=A0AAW1YR82_RUBAR
MVREIDGGSDKIDGAGFATRAVQRRWRGKGAAEEDWARRRKNRSAVSMELHGLGTSDWNRRSVLGITIEDRGGSDLANGGAATASASWGRAGHHGDGEDDHFGRWLRERAVRIPGLVLGLWNWLRCCHGLVVVDEVLWLIRKRMMGELMIW